jgi:hypothetical protein
MKVITAIALALSLGGCATCSQHPVACSIGGAIIVGSVAATVAANSSDHHQRTLVQSPGPQIRP